MARDKYLVNIIEKILCPAHGSFYLKLQIENGRIIIQCVREGCRHSRVISEDDYLYLDALYKLSARILKKWDNYYGKTR